MKIRLLALSAVAAAALAGCATTSPGYGSSSSYPSSNYPSSSASSRCYDCGIVVGIDAVGSGRTAPSKTGAVLGGIVGAIAGHEISDKTGGSKGNQNIATVAGAVGGAVAGNAIQNRATGDSYDVRVRMDDGRTVVINQRNIDGIRENTYVRVVNGKVVLR
ncbi:peptidoglycan-associated outer membrane lipoprotein precursor [Pseudoxanthomonas yeongjuensis]|uniref:glycine zipper 2TM domain-containing protein n=1 Tax=Pseudoxanthomonas yeongjuensis TaxID=377616 RepID=UPI0013907944|nr:glycine zipper 2TM domain-containing protein [Pseudoxanthomonas yeongjuensis]KAF1718048.1 peptidoglycan-associated outer membrane lipoprotein precursor [Pseudoxanthomonas yeongjuensis]